MGRFDVFLCHNSADKPEVIEIAELLKAQGLKPWLDEWELRPGFSWQDILEEQINEIDAAAVFIGENGLGPWQEMELRAYLRKFVENRCPVIPVIMETATTKPELPTFLEGNTWVDFRREDPHPIGQLYWGITGKKLEIIKPPAPPATNPTQSSNPNQPQSAQTPPSVYYDMRGSTIGNVAHNNYGTQQTNKISEEQVKEFASPKTPQPDGSTFFDRVYDSLGIEVDTDKMLEQLNKPATKPHQNYTEDLGNGVKLEMIAIPGGSFMMGSPENESSYFGYHSSQLPQHRVTIQSFYIGRYLITQSQWQEIMGNNPSHFKGDDLPVEQVSWYHAQKFCKALSKKTGKDYRLPSEAEWEYACRAETTTPYYFGKNYSVEYANFGGNVGKTTKVGKYPANGFELYDMYGNVWEWCEDTCHENYKGAPNDSNAWVVDGRIRVIRGGSWKDTPIKCRSALRGRDVPDDGQNDIGFRVVCS
ncbi:Sulphatase-modifying factor protein [Thalassoporum mexicanum PCC 7367]|nr:Sulphatase-modifying factor protein [Pseudanabaena sp. PCC 7367]